MPRLAAVSELSPPEVEVLEIPVWIPAPSVVKSAPVRERPGIVTVGVVQWRRDSRIRWRLGSAILCR